MRHESWLTRRAWWLACCLLLALLAGCGGQGAAPSAGGSAAVASSPALASPVPAAAGTGSTAAIAAPSASCTAFAEGAESTAALNPNQTLCTFHDAQGREVQLTAGRSSRGRERGEFGWAHLRDKHFYGLWEAGGALTRYSVVGAKSESDVIALIGRSLQDPHPTTSADARREYRQPVAGTGYAVLVVVGDNGRIITAYPVPEARR